MFKAILSITLLFVFGIVNGSIWNPISNLKSETFVVGPMPVSDGHHEFWFYDIPKPEGAILVHGYHIDFVDEKRVPIPLQVVYNHHVVIFEETDAGDGTYQIMQTGNKSVTALAHVGCSGAEAARSPVDFPDGFAYQCHGRKWYTVIEMIGLWPAISHMNTTVYMSYTMNYTTPENTPSNVAPLILFRATASEEIYFNVPGDDSENAFAISRTYTFPQDFYLPYIIGHFHIGAINITVTIPDRGLIAVSYPHYDSYYFLDGVTSQTPFELIKANTPVTITGYYDNSKFIPGVMSFVMLYIATNTTLAQEAYDYYNNPNNGMEIQVLMNKMFDPKFRVILITTLTLLGILVVGILALVAYKYHLRSNIAMRIKKRSMERESEYKKLSEVEI